MEMSVFGVFKPEYGQIIPCSWFRGVSEGLDFFYFYGVPYQCQDVTPCQDAKYSYGNPEKRFKELHFMTGYFYDNCYVQGKRVLKDYDPIQLYAFIDQAKQDVSLIQYYLDLISFYSNKIYELEQQLKSLQETTNLYLQLIDSKVKSIESDVSLIKSYKQDELSKLRTLVEHYVRFISSGKGVKSAIITATQSPIPLFVDEMEVRRIILKVPTTALYVVYIGDNLYQDFPLFKGEQIELNVKDPSKVYIRSEYEEKVFALFELAQ